MVYMIVVYDMEAKRTHLPRKALRKYLTHVQNSVFEGEVTRADAEDIEAYLERIVNEQKGESAIIYRFLTDSLVHRSAYGDDPTATGRIL